MLHHSVVLILLSVAVFAAADSAGKVHELLYFNNVNICVVLA